MRSIIQRVYQCKSVTMDYRSLRNPKDSVLHVYADIKGLRTIGYGHRLTPGESFPNGITAAEAEAILSQDVQIAEQAVERLVKVPLTQGEFDALVDFVFNLGLGAWHPQRCSAISMRGSTMLHNGSSWHGITREQKRSPASRSAGKPNSISGRPDMDSDPALKRLYNKYNHTYWRDALPSNTQIWWEPCGPDAGVTIQLDEETLGIKIDPALMGMRRFAKLTLLHEMVHVATWLIRAADHGRIFGYE